MALVTLPYASYSWTPKGERPAESGPSGRRFEYSSCGGSPCISLSARSRARPSRDSKTDAVGLLNRKRVLLRAAGVAISRSHSYELSSEEKYSSYTCDSGSKDVLFQNTHTGTLHDVYHLTDYLPDLEKYPNPLLENKYFHPVRGFFATDQDLVAQKVQLGLDTETEAGYFRMAGPREQVYFMPEDVRAAIVTCGGLCPGLNTVIREIVFGLWYQYGVRDILGIKGGYRGFYSSNTEMLTPKVVSDWHKKGGTMLGTTRGGHDTIKIVDSIQDRGINQVFIIGGDGTQRGAQKVHEEIVRRGLPIAVVGIPKTVDNDVAVIDKSFGFDTAVEAAQSAINAAHVESESTPNGVGLVKVMGRYAGHIAMAATLASRDVDCCLIPEVPFFVDGKGGLFEYMEHRLRDNGHCVILVAEGAGQDLVSASVGSGSTKDASGNRQLLDTGLWLASTLKDRWSKKKKESLSLKYIDPTYMVRAVPSNTSDTIYCTMLAHQAIHGAMAGFTGFVTGPVNGSYCYIPMQKVTSTNAVVNVLDREWAWVRSANNQPDFMPKMTDEPPLYPSFAPTHPPDMEVPTPT